MTPFEKWEDLEFNGLPVGLEYDTTINYPDHEVPKEIVRPTRFERPWVV